MRGYKATNADMTCIEFQFEMDKEFIHEGEIELCESGFHFCTNLFDCFMFYHKTGTRLFEVECEDVSDEVENNSSKRVCGRIKFVKEINIGEQDEEFYLNMVNIWGPAIRLIKNPSPAVQLEAVIQNCWSIKWIENPSVEVQLIALMQTRCANEWIKNPSPAVQLAAVSQNSSAIEFIENPSLEVQLAAMKRNGCAI